jgi:putative aldouronate transport system substrate-binding protein
MKYPEGKSGMADLGWQAGSLAYWPNVMLCKTWYYEPKDIYTKMLEKNKTCNKSLALGFTFDSSKVSDQITACTNVIAQYYTPLMYGEVDIDSTLPDFQNALKKAGIDEIIAEKQKQLDAWLATK